MPFEIIRNDITKMRTDAIVNAANERLEAGGGVCGAIFKAAGESELQAACNAVGGCKTGQVIITPGFNLHAKHIIHAVGPVWHGGMQGEESLLRSCYRNALELARKHELVSISFPLISSGIFGYPKEGALQVAVSEIKSFLNDYEMDVYLVVFDKQAFDISQSRYDSIQSYISEHYVETHVAQARPCREAEVVFSEDDYYSDILSMFGSREEAEAVPMPLSQPMPAAPAEQKKSLADVVNQLEETFSQMLLRLIDEKAYTDTEVYKRANIDRKLFSKIRSNAEYKPSKQTAIAFAIALRLNLDETKDLLARAGYALSRSNKFDVIIEYFIESGVYDIFEINEALFAFGQALLGGAGKMPFICRLTGDHS